MFVEFRKFVARGNVIDLAVAVIIGAAFAKITTSLTNDIIMPLIGRLFGGLDFSGYFTLLAPIPDAFKGNPASYVDLKTAGVAVLGWGEFVTVVINFLILAWIIFLMVRGANRAIDRFEGEKAEYDAAKGPSEIDLLKEIRDELRKR